MSLSLSQKIRKLYPSLTSNDFDPETGTILYETIQMVRATTLKVGIIPHCRNQHNHNWMQFKYI